MMNMILEIIFVVFLGGSVTYMISFAVSNKDMTVLGKITFGIVFLVMIATNISLYNVAIDTELMIPIYYPIGMSIGIVLAITIFVFVKQKK